MIKRYGESIPKDIIGSTLIELAKENDKIVVFSSDVSVSCNVEIFNNAYPRRFFEMGISEQSTMSAAGGIASEGFIPFYVALSIFSCGMTWPQMRQVCNSDLGVKIIGTHAGVDNGQDGTGHHATEDIAIARVIPRMTVITPSDEAEVRAAIIAMEKYDGTIYMRAAREPQPIIHDESYEFEIGKAEVIEDMGDEFAVIYEGTALGQALDGFEKAVNLGAKGKLISIRSIKPIDTTLLKNIAMKVNRIVTVENHSVLGGLYGAVCETLCSMRMKTDIKGIGFNDTFMESGKSKDLKMKYGLSGEAVLEAIMGN